MKPAAFDYIRVETLDEVLSLLADSDLEAKILAGGQSLVPMLNMRLARPKALIDINKLAALPLGAMELKRASQAPLRAPTPPNKHAQGTFLQIGALVRQRQLERYAAEEPGAKLIHTALTHIGHPQTRNQGTIGGSLAHADPSAELPLIFLTLGGIAFLQSTRGERQVAAEDFFQSYFTTALEPDEMLTKTQWKLPAPRDGVAFKEYRRRHGDFALIAAACTMTIESDRTVRNVRLGLGGVSDTPVLVADVQQLVGEQLTNERARAVADAVGNQFDFPDDYQASSAYRRQLATVLMSHVIQAAYEDALAKEGLEMHVTKPPRLPFATSPPGSLVANARRIPMQRIKADTLTPITLRVNGRQYRAAIEPRMLLSDFLREECGLTGTHVGCEHGVCGACTVLVNGEAVRSCLILAVSVTDAEITTIEGLARHPDFPAVYRAFTENHALQCGFCTPGIVVSAMAEVVGRPKEEEEIIDILSGHLCRCTGYHGITAAFRELAQATPSEAEKHEEK